MKNCTKIQNIFWEGFLFNVSHDIRTPMNAILGFAELGQKNLGDAEKTGDCLRKIQISGSKMLAILDNVLELSRIESGKTVVEATAVEAGSVLDACLTMVQPELEKNTLNLRFRAKSSTRMSIWTRRSSPKSS